MVAINKSCPKERRLGDVSQERPRRLSVAQVEALLRGHMQPLLQYAQSHAEVRFEIRDGKANLYYEGGTLVRLERRESKVTVQGGL